MNRLVLFLFVIWLLTSCSLNFTQPSPPPVSSKWSSDLVSTPPPDNSVTIPTAKNGKLYLGKKLLLDLEDRYANALCGGIEISYSPTYEFFLVIIKCHEGFNDAFLFRSKGGRGRIITGDDHIQDSNYIWSPNGQSLVYFRSGTLMDQKPELPSGHILYSVPTSNKILLRTYFDNSSEIQWSPDGHWLAYTIGCKVILASFDGYSLWEIDEISECSKDATVNWERDKEQFLLKYTSSNSSINRIYEIEQVQGQPPTHDAILINNDVILMNWDESWKRLK